MLTVDLLIAAASFVACSALLAAWLRFGLGQRLLALPNDRSSHSQPTPTGGGVVIVLVVTAVLLGYFAAGVPWAGWLALGCLGIASLGLVDDAFDLSARLRLALQVVLISLLLWSGNLATLSQIGFLAEFPAWVVAPLAAVALVWFVNLYNFMDGIDGLATAQSGSYCLAALFFMLGDAGWYTGVLWSGVACSLGFGIFNAAPARIFMGDVGSAFWGLLIGVLALQLAVAGALPLTVSLVLLSAFWFDATYTLVTRVLTGQRFTEGHRSHLYQRLADRLGHARTTALYIAFFLLWQWPIAAWIRADFLSKSLLGPGAMLTFEGGWGVAFACLPLLVGCVWLKAGVRLPEPQIDAPRSL